MYQVTVEIYKKECPTEMVASFVLDDCKSIKKVEAFRQQMERCNPLYSYVFIIKTC